jgi:hypothetical protein
LKRRDPCAASQVNLKHAACQSRLPGEIEFRFIRFLRAKREFNLTSVIDLEKLL